MSSEGANKECYAFQETGSCRFGDRCRYSHGASHPGVSSSRPPRRAAGGAGAGGDKTCYSFAQSGSCRFGDQCRFEHNGAAAAPAASSSGAAASSRPRRSRHASKNQQCHSFRDSASCQYGDQCRFAHGENDQRDLQALKRRAAGVCYNWKESGECKFGDNCRYAHEDVPEKASA